MPVDTTSYQLTFDLELPEEEGGEPSALSVQEIQLRKEAARALLESPDCWPKDELGQTEQPFWFEHYMKLSEGRWPFRVAVLIAWLATPKKYRWPKTQKELADLLGMSSDRQFTVWRAKNPAINMMVHEAWRDRVLDGLSDSVDAMLEVAARPDYKSRGDRELHFKMADVLTERMTINGAGTDLSQLTFDQKLKLAGLDDPEKLSALMDELKAEAAHGAGNGDAR